MSNINTQATVTLQVNGQQAEKTLAQLRSNALQLEAAIAKAAAAGNKADLKRLRKELGETKKQIRDIESSTMQVEGVMRRLDRATPKELQKTLQTLNRQLDYLERGSDAWNAHIDKIKKVKAEIAAVNDEIRGQEGWFSRFNRTLNDWQMTIMGAAAAATGLVMAGRKAVSAYADMDAEMANVRKYTGMTAEQVADLNEEFKKMDTRTSREGLNQLAEEAGRLGKTSKEDILGFVRAADKINVALDELGEGATLTLSKLTTIFGDEERLGTEKALLSVGSVINELSQNCTASAPYLANFAQRLAGVGAQANMTIPQIMGFAAVLDSQGQKVEMSATALSKLIMDLFKNPAKIAKATGMELKTFTDTCVKDTNEGLLMLLERLHQLGDMSVLAPVFADMGENGARASAVISALAGNLDMVKWEQQEAAKAFKEGTSVTKEYNVQNTTVQAELDKARKRVNELAVELGEKLMPVMRHIYSSTSLLLRALSAIVSFTIEHKAAILTTTAAVVAYTVAVNASNIAFKAHYAWLVISQTAQKALAATSATLRTAYALLQIGIAKLTNNHVKLTWWQLEVNKAMKANAFGLILAAAVALGAAIYNLVKNYSSLTAGEKALNDIRKKATDNIAEEKQKIDTLVAAAHNERLSLEERQRAINELNSIIPKYNGQLDATTGKYRENKQALDAYIQSLIRQYEIEGAKDKLKEIGKRKAEIKIEQQEIKQEQKKIDDQQKALESHPSTGTQAYGTAGVTMSQAHAVSKTGARMSLNSRMSSSNRELSKLNEEEAAITKVYGDDIQKSAVKPPKPSSPSSGGSGGSGGTGSGSSGGGGSSSGKTDKFASENEWKKMEDATNRIAYAKGEKDFLAYSQRMLEIEVEYNQKKLEHTDLTEAERLSIQAEYYEAVKKQREDADKQTIDEENAAYAEQLSNLKQRYIDGKVSLKVYEEATEQAEMAHLQRLASLYEDGSKEQLDVQKQLQDKSVANLKKHQKEYEAEVKKHQDALAKIKEEVFGLNPQERQAKYAADLAMLTEVYNAEIRAAADNAKEKLRIEKAFQQAKAALQEQYNIENADSNMNFLQSWNNYVISFLESDTGWAITGAMDVVASSMSSVFQQLSSIVEAELEIQTAAIEKKYEREVELAEGNNYKVKQLEKQKEAEVAKVKNEANKKMFAMQVMQALAQTAMGAINAYSSAAQVPLIGYILAPIAAATAVAAGMLQVAAIKKQQQASEAQGYSAGGFTPEGPLNQAVGVVHAGEWVASQKLVRDPKTRPLLEALDYAQKHNAIGSLNAADVSQSITASSRLASLTEKNQAAPQQVIVQNLQPSSNEEMKEMASVIGALKERLDEPFITVNTVTGDFGSKKAQDDYDRLIRNKSPKSHRS